MKYVFFGSSEFSVYVLEELKLHSLLPSLIVTTPDKPKGRKLILSPAPTKIWGQENNIEVIDPTSIRNNSELVSRLKGLNAELFLVASYGKIIPREIFDIPERKTLNIHPSLLPKYRGASPIISQILNDEKEIGVSIMQIEEAMDAGPIVVKASLRFEEQSSGDFANEIFSLDKTQLEKTLAVEGARLFAHVLPEWLSGSIQPIMQIENDATYCKKIKKEDGELMIDLNDLTFNARENYLKIRAFQGWPTAYFFLRHDGASSEGSPTHKRIIITKATYENNTLKILNVIPEGKKEMPFEDFLRGLR